MINSLFCTLSTLCGRLVIQGRVEFRMLLTTYLISLVFQLVTAGALLEQGTQAITTLTAIHCGIISSLFWALLWYAFTTMQVLDDGRTASVMVRDIIELGYIFLIAMIWFDGFPDHAHRTICSFLRHDVHCPCYSIRLH